MVESYEVVLKTFLEKKLVMLLEKSWPYDPPIRSTWWREDHICSYHRSKGHNTKNCFNLKDVIQDLIYASKVIAYGLVKNSNHKALKKTLPKYEKWESFKASKKNHDGKINYTYTDTDNVINVMELIEYLCMMGPKFYKEPNYDTDDEIPKVVLKTCNAQQ